MTRRHPLRCSQRSCWNTRHLNAAGPPKDRFVPLALLPRDVALLECLDSDDSLALRSRRVDTFAIACA
jgi:hypothetical protein